MIIYYEENLINNRAPIGGVGLVNRVIEPKTVEINESKFFHWKYHRWKWREGHWVFGLIERGTRNCCLVEVEQRDTATLLPLISEWILPGSHIVSDGWAAYKGIGQLNGGVYTHAVVVHEDNFVDPNDPETHTQNVESMWRMAKKMFRDQYGTSRQLFEHHIVEFMWREKYRDNQFSVILTQIRDQYPV